MCRGRGRRLGRVRLSPLLLLPAAVLAPWLVSLLAGCGQNPSPVPPTTPSDTGAVAQAQYDAFYKQEKDNIAERFVDNPGTPWGDYVGSTACASCHADEYARWRKSFHSRTFYAAVDGTILGPFDGRTLDTHAHVGLNRRVPSPYVAKVYTRKDESGRTRYYMWLRDRTEAEGWPRGMSRDTYGKGANNLPYVGDGVELEVLFAFGNRRHQPYIARWSSSIPSEAHDGKHYVLPFYWNAAEGEWMWDGFREYVESCAQCHVSGIKRSETPWSMTQRAFSHTDRSRPPLYNLAPTEEGWSEGAVGCEVCHGPGRPHLLAVEAMGPEAYRKARREGKKPPSIFPSTKGSDTRHRLTQQCDSCHNFDTESTVTWIPGPRGYGRDALHKPLDPKADPLFAQHYPDGSKKSPCSMGHVYRQTKMWHADVNCVDCHDPHGSDHFGSLKKSVRDNSLCIDCHVDLADEAAQTRHSRHAAGSPGNQCIECHMPRHLIFTNGQQMMSDRLHSHLIGVPKGGALDGAPPTSCNICHTDRDEAWSKAEIASGWAEERALPR
jgi:predicted CXXCH cytochrome family protein